MNELTLRPSSGYENSYYDIMFTVDIGPHEEGRISFRNATTNEDLKVLGVNDGIIEGQNTILTCGKQTVAGYINLFNHDKMNQGLIGHDSVDIVCRIRAKRNGSDAEDVIRQSFLNESAAVDQTIPPFDLAVQSQQVDLSKQAPLVLTISSYSVGHYELCVERTEEPNLRSTFEIVTKPGEMKIEVPSMVLYDDLKPCEDRSDEYHICWAKRTGRLPGSFLGRTYIPLEQSKFRFFGRPEMPQPQTRLDPVGRQLPETFLLSDRYWVHCHESNSNLANFRRSPFTHNPGMAVYRIEMEEAQQARAEIMNSLNQDGERLKENEATLAKEVNLGDLAHESDLSLRNDAFAEFSEIYLEKASQILPSDGHRRVLAIRQKAVVSSVNARGSNDCGCSRGTDKNSDGKIGHVRKTSRNKFNRRLQPKQL